MDLENQVLYSVDIGEKDSSVSFEEVVRTSGGISSKNMPDKVVCCGIEERRLITYMAIFDILTLLRIPAAICMCMNTRGLRCYYKFRVLTFFIFLLAAIALFGVICVENIQERISAGATVMTGIAEGIFIVTDHVFNKFLKRSLLR